MIQHSGPRASRFGAAWRARLVDIGLAGAAVTLVGALLVQRFMPAETPAQDRKFNRARSSIRRTYGAIAYPARAGRRAAA